MIGEFLAMRCGKLGKVQTECDLCSSRPCIIQIAGGDQLSMISGWTLCDIRSRRWALELSARAHELCINLCMLGAWHGGLRYQLDEVASTRVPYNGKSTYSAIWFLDSIPYVYAEVS